MNFMDEQCFPIHRFGRRLGTRLEGTAACQHLLEALQRLGQPGRLIVSLEHVEVLSGSFADEAIGIPYGRLAAGEYGDRFMLLRSPSLDLADDLAHKLDRRRLAMLCLLGDGWEVLGQLPPPMRETLALVIEQGRTTAKRLAQGLGIRHNACLHRVSRLAALRLIRREAVGVAGPHPSYRLFSLL